MPRPKMFDGKMEQLSFSLPTELIAQIRQGAENKHIPLAAYIRLLLTEQLKKEHKNND